jgi:hypothetical protein
VQLPTDGASLPAPDVLIDFNGAAIQVYNQQIVQFWPTIHGTIPSL